MEIRKGTLADTEPFIHFLQEVKDTMAQKEWFYLDPPDYVREMMSQGRIDLWVAMDGDRIAAIFNTILPGLDSCNYGYDLALSEEELLRVINMDNAAVHPDYQGQGLQRRMMEIAEEELRLRGNRILLCTIHPDNSYSLNNALKRGFTIQKKLSKYGSVRYILRKDI